ncbi:hybrid sensor histidine kinase/response regulator [Halomonas sp. GFAJ-1]|uniref:hybrid sensor histidine kinase/response regulator n=1 Tax=Halomonas sp. GFAJ-1 TaxID=1118153 RepID=UPI00023A4BDC|nr:hybrid sensor histidine kinase/response regulator [Halomonas sp. GFAJ-1]AVI62294.1 hybrid sensor histidine kinase/response regulator [Halomonas sp. GFAJ-1]EHK59689.1 gliding motility regulatory protein [Halomonas sp. GFAJ-1]
MALDIRRFIQRFVEEAADHLPRLREGISALEQGYADREQINELFRAAHTLKGSSRMLKLAPITALAHSTEELLSALRDGTLTASPTVTSLLNQAVDGLSDFVSQLAQGATGDDLPATDEALCNALEQAALQTQPLPSTPAPPLPVTPSAPSTSTALTTESELRLSDTVRVRLDRLDDVIRLMGEVLSGHHHLHTLVDQARALSTTLPAEQQAPFHAFHRELKDSVLSHDSLMNDLHDRALQMRMLPLSVVFDPLAHMSRELAQSLGKQVDCRLRGAEIELDRQMIDRLSDPLIHLLRNALDHGFEPPAERVASGKSPRGKLVIEAWQDADWVMVEMHDDGAGIALDAVRQKALAKQLVSEEQLNTLSEQETLELIFLPGFSTKSMITDFSGRGVGLDVVKRTVMDELNGDLQLTSERGSGTRFTLRLPLSLAMMRVLLISVGGVTLGVTAPYVSELVECSPGSFIDAAGQRTLILRNEFVPVVSLAQLLELPETTSDTDNTLLLVVHQRHQKLALIIDSLIDERDMVIKPLPVHLRHLPLVSGMVSMGRNALVSLLHIPALLEATRHNVQHLGNERPSSTLAKRILVVDDSLNTREIEKDVLEAWGYHVTLAENGRDGLAKALAEPFDAVLTDVEMPIMDGFALTARLRENEVYRYRPIIIITSREKESDRRRGIEVGADAYIVKGSFDQNNLVETLQALLG